MAKLITPNGETTEIQPANGTDFQLEELYKLIGCELIQTAPAVNGELLIFDEEFLCKADPILNPEATKKMHPNMGPFVYNVICGNAILCKDDELR